MFSEYLLNKLIHASVIHLGCLQSSQICPVRICEIKSLLCSKCSNYFPPYSEWKQNLILSLLGPTRSNLIFLANIVLVTLVYLLLFEHFRFGLNSEPLGLMLSLPKMHLSTIRCLAPASLSLGFYSVVIFEGRLFLVILFKIAISLQFWLFLCLIFLPSNYQHLIYCTFYWFAYCFFPFTARSINTGIFSHCYVISTKNIAWLMVGTYYIFLALRNLISRGNSVNDSSDII